MANEAGTSQRGAHAAEAWPCGCLESGTMVWYCQTHLRELAFPKMEHLYDQRPARYRFGVTIRKRLRAEPPDIGADVPGGGAV